MWWRRFVRIRGGETDGGDRRRRTVLSRPFHVSPSHRWGRRESLVDVVCVVVVKQERVLQEEGEEPIERQCLSHEKDENVSKEKKDG